MSTVFPISRAAATVAPAVSSGAPFPARFRETFCAHVGVQVDAYSSALLRRTMYPHARVVFLLLNRVFPRLFAADRTLVADVAQAAKPRDALFALDDFYIHPDNHRFLRREFRLRISARRFERLLREVWGAPPPRTK
ncbi:MAG: hypothetical protein V4773_27025 [Verrucomicrobiota bacterium]